jgi:uncharacterized protein (TIGR02646 family)
MIHIPRPLPIPPGLAEAAARELERYLVFMQTQRMSKSSRATAKKSCLKPAKGTKRAETRVERFEWKAYRLEEVKATLERAFHCKCAYCESDYSAVASVRIEHFRPKGRVDREGMTPIDGYYWLAAEWTNLLPSCERCNSPKRDFIPALNRRVTVGKANWFPLWDETKRATKPGEEEGEYPLLLNPCEDDPKEYLSFDENGMVEPLDSLPQRDMAKAEKSIRLYGLGRMMLVKARHEYAKRVLAQIQRVEEHHCDWRTNPKDAERRRGLLQDWNELARFLAPDRPYLALANQVIAAKITLDIRSDIAGLVNWPHPV